MISVHGDGVGVVGTNVNIVKLPVIQQPAGIWNGGNSDLCACIIEVGVWRRKGAARTDYLDSQFVLDWGYLNEDGSQGVISIHSDDVGISRTNINTIKQPMIQHPTRSRQSINRNHRALIIHVSSRRRISGARTNNLDS